MTHTMVVGTSEAQDFEIFGLGAGGGTGFDVAIDWRGNAPGSPDVTVAWLSQAAGTVRVTDVENMAVGTYQFRFMLEDGAGNIGYAPNGAAADTWKVVRA